MATSAEPPALRAFARMVAVPGLFPVARPVLSSIETMFTAEDSHSTAKGGAGFPSVKVAPAPKSICVLAGSDGGFLGVISIVSSATTVMVAGWETTPVAGSLAVMAAVVGLCDGHSGFLANLDELGLAAFPLELIGSNLVHELI